MPWTSCYLPDLDAVLTVYGGLVSPASLTEAVKAALELAREHGTQRFLTDCSTLEGGHSIVDLYEQAKIVEATGISHCVHEAIILPQLEAAADDVLFWETTCRNRGFDVRIFATAADARAWLACLKQAETVQAPCAE